MSSNPYEGLVCEDCKAPAEVMIAGQVWCRACVATSIKLATPYPPPVAVENAAAALARLEGLRDRFRAEHPTSPAYAVLEHWFGVMRRGGRPATVGLQRDGDFLLRCLLVTHGWDRGDAIDGMDTLLALEGIIISQGNHQP